MLIPKEIYYQKLKEFLELSGTMYKEDEYEYLYHCYGENEQYLSRHINIINHSKLIIFGEASLGTDSNLQAKSYIYNPSSKVTTFLNLKNFCVASGRNSINNKRRLIELLEFHKICVLDLSPYPFNVAHSKTFYQCYSDELVKLIDYFFESHVQRKLEKILTTDTIISVRYKRTHNKFKTLIEAKTNRRPLCLGGNGMDINQKLFSSLF